MSDFHAFYPHGTQQLAFDSFPKHYGAFNFDSASFGTDQCAAQDPQEFEDDLEAILAQAALNLEVPVLTDNSAVFEQIRGGTPTRGVPSTFTVSSESAYDSVYNENDSVYTYNSDLSALMNFQALGVVDSDYSVASPISPHSSPSSNIGMTMPTYSPPTYSHRGSYSDYEPTHIRVPPSSASDYYPQMTVSVKYASPAIQATVSPANVSAQLPSAHPHQATIVASQVKQENLSRASTTKDPKRKYSCPQCPRGMYQR
jgi:transcription factor CRZ1